MYGGQEPLGCQKNQIDVVKHQGSKPIWGTDRVCRDAIPNNLDCGLDVRRLDDLVLVLESKRFIHAVVYEKDVLNSVLHVEHDRFFIIV